VVCGWVCISNSLHRALRHNPDAATTISRPMSEQLHNAITIAIQALAKGQGATVSAVASQAGLMALGCVVAEASDHGRTTPSLDVTAGVVVVFLEEAADSLEEHPQAGTTPNRAAAARAALGLEPGTQGKPLRGHRGQTGRVGTIARWLAYQPASLFKTRKDGNSAFDALITDMAEHLLRREVAFLIDQQRLAQQARRPPLESAMRIDWLARFERYYAVWSCIAGLRNDIAMALLKLRAGETADTDYFIRKSLYYHACFLTELEAFTRDHGGLWVLPDPKAEQLVADAVWMIRKPTSLTEIDESILRIAVGCWREIATFVQATHTDTALRGLAETWRAWVASCACKSTEHPQPDCSVHQSLSWAASFMSALDEQWDLLADWYDVPRPASAVTSCAADSPDPPPHLC
jgi:hypothetical protein